MTGPDPIGPLSLSHKNYTAASVPIIIYQIMLLIFS